MHFVTSAGQFLWDFVVGDTPEIAVGALLILAIAAVLSSHGLFAVVLVPMSVLALLIASVQVGRGH